MCPDEDCEHQNLAAGYKFLKVLTSPLTVADEGMAAVHSDKPRVATSSPTERPQVCGSTARSEAGPLPRVGRGGS